MITCASKLKNFCGNPFFLENLQWARESYVTEGCDVSVIVDLEIAGRIGPGSTPAPSTYHYRNTYVLQYTHTAIIYTEK